MEENRSKTYRSYIVDKNLRQEVDYDLFHDLWAGIDSIIPDKTIVYLVPDGVYHSINPCTLNMQAGGYLADIKDIRLLSSLIDVIKIKEQSNNKSKSQIAAIFGIKKFTSTNENKRLAVNYNSNIGKGNVQTYNSRSENVSGFSQLVGIKTEITQIEILLRENKWAINLFIDENANKENLKSITNPTLLHIATHGFFKEDSMAFLRQDPFYSAIFSREFRLNNNPLLRSGLTLSGINNNPNSIAGKEFDHDFVTAYELSTMTLDSTELVVLSACETGLGEIKNGEGVFGLQRAFRMAGAKSLIMSLWKVDDEATQLLMTLFYQKWLSGMTKREAFRAAQLELRKNPLYEHPYYWGAFVMIGE